MSLEKSEAEVEQQEDTIEKEASEAIAAKNTEEQKVEGESEFSRRAHRIVDEVIEEVVEEEEVNGKKEKHRGIYLLPNLFTTGALFSGFYAIVAGMNHDFSAAAIAIFVAMILDGLDGRVARIDRKSTRLNSSHVRISYAVFCLK